MVRFSNDMFIKKWGIDSQWLFWSLQKNKPKESAIYHFVAYYYKWAVINGFIYLICIGKGQKLYGGH